MIIVNNSICLFIYGHVYRSTTLTSSSIILFSIDLGLFNPLIYCCYSYSCAIFVLICFLTRRRGLLHYLLFTFMTQHLSGMPRISQHLGKSRDLWSKVCVASFPPPCLVTDLSITVSLTPSRVRWPNLFQRNRPAIEKSFEFGNSYNVIDVKVSESRMGYCLIHVLSYDKYFVGGAS